MTRDIDSDVIFYQILHMNRTSNTNTTADCTGDSPKKQQSL